MIAVNRSTRGAVSRVLLDTNILLRLAQPLSVEHSIAKGAILQLAGAEIVSCIVPQSLYEFWVVATRPLSSNGLGWSASTAERGIVELIQDYLLLKDERGVFRHWHSLVTTYGVTGKNAHDARLVAAMKRHGLTQILTFNVADFRRYSDINVLSPADVVSGRAKLS